MIRTHTSVAIPGFLSGMPLFLAITLGLSHCLILAGFWIDRSAVKARINGANGLPFSAALILSFLSFPAVAVIAGIFGR